MKNHYKFWIVFSMIIIFAAGLVAGIFIDKHIIQKKIRRGPAPFPTLKIMSKELNLTLEQEQKIREIFKNNDERFKSLRKEMDGKLSAIRTQLKKEIDSVLSEEQRKKIEAMIEKYLSQRRREVEKTRKHREDRERQDKKGEKR